MPDKIFDHDKLDVYRLSIEYVADSFCIAKDRSGLHRHARSMAAAAQLIPLNIAEGNGKRSVKTALDTSTLLEVQRSNVWQSKTCSSSPVEWKTRAASS